MYQMEIAQIQYLVVVLVVILISMTLHEMAHGYVAYWLGDYTPKAQGRLSFNPLKHLDPFLSIIMPLIMAISGGPIFGGAKPVQINSNKIKGGDFGFALVAIAGPLTNFILSFICFCILYYVNPGGPLGLGLAIAVQVNLGFFIFNMIPIPPLDGSRLLYALAPDFVKDGMKKIERYGGILIVFILVMVAGTFLTSFMQGAVVFFLELFNKIMI